MNFIYLTPRTTALEMKYNSIYFIILSTMFLHLSFGAQSNPKTYFKICHRKEKEFNKCIKDAILSAKEKIITGIPDLNLVQLDPLYLPKIDMTEGVGLKFIMINTTVTGLRNFSLQEVRIDKSLSQMNMSMFTPTILFKSNYHMEGKILSFPIQGKGKASMFFTNVTTNSFGILEQYKANGTEYIRIKDLKWDIVPSNAMSHFTGLFNGNKALGDATNTFLNDNWRDTFESYRHVPQKIFGVIFKELANRVFRNFPVNSWFPE